MSWLFTTLTIVSLLLVLATCYMAWRSYSALPARIPIHFGITGKPDRWGAKSMIWLLPLVAASIFISFSVLRHAGGGKGARLFGAIEVDTIAMMWVVTRGQILVALGRARGLGPSYWGLLALTVATALSAHFLIR